MEYFIRTISREYHYEFREKGSRFIAYLFPVSSEAEFKTKLHHLKLEYHDASHHCYAFRIDTEGNLARSSDDGEPSGTAGKPIMNQILSANLAQCAIVVIRYFGGIKLGTGGLIKAYKEASKLAIASAEIISIEKKAPYKVVCLFENSGEVLKIIRQFRCEIQHKTGADKLAIDILVPIHEIIQLEEKLKTIPELRITHRPQ